MRWLRLVFRVFGWLLTPFLAWAASFFGAVGGALIAMRMRDPVEGLAVTAVCGALAGFAVIIPGCAICGKRRKRAKSWRSPRTARPTRSSSCCPAPGVSCVPRGAIWPPRSWRGPPEERAGRARRSGNCHRRHRRPTRSSLRAPGGAEIWFTLARADSGDGGRCVDRAIEIRHGGAHAGAAPLHRRRPPRS